MMLLLVHPQRQLWIDVLSVVAIDFSYSEEVSGLTVYMAGGSSHQIHTSLGLTSEEVRRVAHELLEARKAADL